MQKTFQKTFTITYRDKESGELITVEKTFTGSSNFPPELWVEDWAYALTDKGWYQIKEVPEKRK